MKTIEQLYNGFYLNEKSANSQISNGKMPLRIAPLKKVKNYEKLEIDYDHFAFAEKNRFGEIEYFHGLKNFLLIEKSGFPPVFIFDNHNHAIVFRYNIIYNNEFKNFELIHIDQHSDCWGNKNHLKINLNENELEKVFNFANERCNVGNFIPPAIESGMISDLFQVRSIIALQNLKTHKNQIFILDIDLDFCLDGIEKDKVNYDAVKVLKNKFDKIGKNALGITIATSPYFLDQQKAIEIIRELIF